MKRLITRVSVLLLAALLWSQPVQAQGKSPDFDGGGTVDVEDFFLFQLAFDSTKPADLAKFDLDNSGVVDMEDFFAFALRFGETIPKGPPQTTLSGQVEVPADADVQVSQLKVISSISKAGLGSGQSFNVAAPDMQSTEVLMVTDAQDEPILLSYTFPSGLGPALKRAAKLAGLDENALAQATGPKVTPQTTALALVMSSPYLIGTTAEQRAEFAARVVAT